MTVPKSSNTVTRASARIACYGTAFLADVPLDLTALKRGIAANVPQFSSPRLDASFLANCGAFLSGKIAALCGPNLYFKRVTGGDFRQPKAIHVCQFSAELHDLLAELSDERAAEIALEWNGMQFPAKTKPPGPNGQTQRRLAILKNLAALARQAKLGNKMLMLRVEYRKQR